MISGINYTIIYLNDNVDNGIRPQKELFHEICSAGEGVVIFARKPPFGKGWQHIGALPVVEAFTVYDLLPPTELSDVYFTLNTFYRIGAKQKNGLRQVYNRGTCRRTGAALPGQRPEVNLQDLRFLYVDMDFYHFGRTACQLGGYGLSAAAGDYRNRHA